MKHWHVISYDIREPKRLQRLYRYLSRQAVPLQRSVFLYKGSQEELRALQQTIKKYTQASEDDVRIYPLSHPDQIWSAGQQVNTLNSLYPVNTAKPSKIQPIRRLLAAISPWSTKP